MTPEDKIDDANHRLPESVHYMVEVDYFTDHGARLDIVQTSPGSVVVESLGYRDVLDGIEEYLESQLAAVRAAKELKPEREQTPLRRVSGDAETLSVNVGS